MSDTPGDLGFRHRTRKGGEVVITRSGRIVTTLRGGEALDFLARAAATTFEESQRLMARLTGNYRRGNERSAARHPRNRR